MRSAGDSRQAFGPACAHHGLVVLAIDSICCEDRGAHRAGIEPDPDADADWLQHSNQMCYRLLGECIAPRKTLFVSATEDKYSQDAEVIVQTARETFVVLGAEHNLAHRRYSGGHPLTQEPFEDIVEWIVAVCRE